ncbi:MAG: serine/threonine protein kinase, partial [Elusimicrobia bacterium]|nr:serine/threonine protein kinase [Elusimicrobiota bacterium]
LWLRRPRPRRAAPPAPRGGEERRALDAQYEIVEKIGEGGMGTVYKGWDKVLKRPVAVKRLRAELQRNPRERERFIKEAEMVASLRHPHIVEIHTILRDEEDTYLVFEYILGRTLHELLNESLGRHLEPAEAARLLKQVAAAVDHAHSRRVIHRDLKPANIMIADGGWAKVMDFGIARQVQDSMLTTTNTIVGTPTYMAPEQAMGAVVKESDVYALGVTLYETLTGGLPFPGPDEMRDKLDARFLPPSRLLPGLPRALDAVLAKALAPRAEDRYRSCLDLYEAAAEALDVRATPTP